MRLEQLPSESLIVFSLAIALLPFILTCATSYLKISIVLGMMRNGLGVQGVPGPMTVVVLSIALSWYIMNPTIMQMYEAYKASSPAHSHNFSLENVIDLANKISPPLRDFMQKNSSINEIKSVGELNNNKTSQGGEVLAADLSFPELLLAFMLSELKSAFFMGFLLLLPFLAVDLVVTNTLTALGMSMLSPAVISLPLKLILFVVADGWLLLGRSLISAFN